MADAVEEGAQVRLKLASGREVQGRVSALDRANQVAFVETPIPGESPSELCDVTAVNLARVVSVEVVGERAPLEAWPAIAAEDAEKLEKAASRRCERLLLERPAGVSKEGAAIYDVLSRTFKCQWGQGHAIETNIQVSIRPPYRPEDVVGKDTKAVLRVQQILGKIRERANGSSAAPAHHHA